MARIFCLLWFLALILCCCYGSQTDSIEISMISNPPQTFRTKVEFKCETDYTDTGIFWVLQEFNSKLHFITYVTSRSKEVTGTLQGYKSIKTGSYYQLTIANFEENHEGTYFCVRHRNQKLLFSSGIPVHLPVKTTTVPPTTLQQISTTTKGLIKEGIKCPNSTDIVMTNTKSTMFSCELYILVPLVGVSLLLLITLIIVISICCGPKRRRRKCKCIRPTNGTNGVHTKTIPRQ